LLGGLSWGQVWKEEKEREKKEREEENE